MGVQSAFTAIFAGCGDAVVARAVVGLPGLTVDERFGSFPTWTQANERARQLNEGLGLTQSQVRAIVIEVRLKAEALILECESLLETASQLQKRERRRHYKPEHDALLAQLELGVTFCQVACTCHNVQKERLLKQARNTLSYAMSALGKFEFSIDGVNQIETRIERLKSTLDEFS